jgi:hypothetical protein
MRAGGFNEFADKKRVRVTRKSSPNDRANRVIEVDVGAIIEQGDSGKDVVLEPGDLIYVPGRLFKF